MLPPLPPPADLLPHRPPMLLLVAVVSHEAGRTVCAARFDEGFASHTGGEVSAAFGLELIAQAAAVHHGLHQLAAGKGPAPAARGLLLGSRRLRLDVRTLPVGEILHVTVVEGGAGAGSGGMIRFEGQVETIKGAALVSGDATVLEIRPDDVQLA